MAISAKLVKELREKTGAGMMDCKKALEACNGDLEASFDWLREKGIAKAAKKADRIAAEGLTAFVVDGNAAAIVEVNSETDFVAKNAEFQELVALTAKTIVNAKPQDVEAALQLDVEGKDLGTVIAEKSGKIGEKLSLRRFTVMTKNDDEIFGAYSHMGGKMCALVKASGIDEGRLNKNLKEMCLVDQAFIKDSDQTVAQYLGNGRVLEMVRFEVGEGMEKREENFAEEVAAQMRG